MTLTQHQQAEQIYLDWIAHCRACPKCGTLKKLSCRKGRALYAKWGAHREIARVEWALGTSRDESLP